MNDHPLWLLVLVGALGTARLTRLVVADSITESFRSWLTGYDEHGAPIRQRLGLFIRCPWCVSIWIAAAVVAVSVLIPAQWVYVGAVLSASYVAGFLSRFE